MTDRAALPLGTVVLGDCLDVMAEWSADSVDAVVCDPPYGLEFMGRGWDKLDGGLGIDAAFGYWLAGFTDGEGCFSVHRKPQGTLDCQFSISLRGDDMPVLEHCQRMTRLGTLAMQRPEGQNPKARWTVSSKADCTRLRDLFRAFPLRAKKAREFEEWSVALDEWLHHEVGEWDGMQASRERLMSMRPYEEGGIRISPDQMWHYRWAREALRIAKPGAYLIAAGGTRTVHRLACAIEDAGWEIRDMLIWGFASGFPKSLNVSAALRKLPACSCDVAGEIGAVDPTLPSGAVTSERGRALRCPECGGVRPDLIPEGMGTALKPSYEPWILARKPLRGTVASNVLKYGTGALNIDATRIGFASEADFDETANKNAHADFGTEPGGNAVYGDYSMVPRRNYRDRHGGGAKGSSGFVDGYEKGAGFVESTQGRWPANIVLTETPDGGGIFDGGWDGVVGGGEARSAGDYPVTEGWTGEGYGGRFSQGSLYSDSGTYSRFFLIPKAARSEREPVLGGLEERVAGAETPMAGRGQGGLRCRICNKWKVSGSPCVCPEPDFEPTDFVRPDRANHHPTVKPVDLMRHLVRLVTPPGGTVLDCFLGSGTTALAAEMEGFAWVGIEREAEYVAIAEARLNGTQRGLGLDTSAPEPQRSPSKSHWPARRGPHKAEGWGFSGGQEGLLERTEDDGG